MRRISSGSPFEAAMGYSRAVVKGQWCFVSGTTGYDYARMVMPDSAADQAQNAFATIDAALREAGFAMGDVVRVRYVVTDAALVDEITPVLGTWLGEVRPAATMIVAGLIRPEMKIEIDVTALRA
ncbi:MAG: RidA family protein [Paracoccus sp. (in: a-proteobacteria)]|uniref:RidA family protein n=1 Tax=Paracoccus sp. TaxID=267 RepID=UPI0026E0F206|nr:RidA family protein [Paracoccus sp. (in: a-proteobacteria)]MDO5612581.1 RidA family protein [Paracoccus sp. (in: a-proteobacteria)]